MIKAAFFDIDGTLVGFKTHRVPEMKGCFAMPTSTTATCA